MCGAYPSPCDDSKGAEGIGPLPDHFFLAHPNARGRRSAATST
ncbi:hypothetical protein ACFWM7_30350 [Streptomyces sp. NPDC058375]